MRSFEVIFTYTSKLILGACFPLIGGNSSSYDDDELEQLKIFIKLAQNLKIFEMLPS